MMAGTSASSFLSGVGRFAERFAGPGAWWAGCAVRRLGNSAEGGLTFVRLAPRLPPSLVRARSGTPYESLVRAREPRRCCISNAWDPRRRRNFEAPRSLSDEVKARLDTVNGGAAARFLGGRGGDTINQRIAGSFRRAESRVVLVGLFSALVATLVLASGAQGVGDGHALSHGRTSARSAGATPPCVVPGQRHAPDCLEPSLPIRAAFYYVWFPHAWSQQGLSLFTHYSPYSRPLLLGGKLDDPTSPEGHAIPGALKWASLSLAGTTIDIGRGLGTAARRSEPDAVSVPVDRVLWESDRARRRHRGVRRTTRSD